MVDNLESDRFTVAVLHDMKTNALEAHGPRIGSQEWASESQLERFVALAMVAILRQHVAEEAAIRVPIESFATTARLDVNAEMPTTKSSSSRRDFEFARTTGDPKTDDAMGWVATQVRQILGYDNVVFIDDTVEAGRLDIVASRQPTNEEYDRLGELGQTNGISIIVNSQE